MKSIIDIPSAEAVLDPTVYTVQFCDLLKYPERYHRKLIRTRAIFDNGVDWASLRDDACPDNDGLVGAIGAIESIDKLIESKSRRKIGAVIDRLVREKWDGPLEVNADMLGRFYAGVRYRRSYRFAILHEFEAWPTKKRW